MCINKGLSTKKSNYMCINVYISIFLAFLQNNVYKIIVYKLQINIYSQLIKSRNHFIIKKLNNNFTNYAHIHSI